MTAGIDPKEFRRALGQFATGVTIVTAIAEDGARVGITANSFASVSLDPPLVLWSIARQALTFPHFQRAGWYAINVLGAQQHALSRRFATAGIDKFDGIPWDSGLHGLPLLPGALARFECRAEARHDGGDHLILVGRVERFEQFGGEPLVFHSGIYRIATTHPDVEV